MLYFRILNALYGFIESDLLWYDLYENTLKYLSFVINPYDQCVANKIIDGKQCAIHCYVNNNKVYSVDMKINAMIIEVTAKYFGDLVLTRETITLY